MKTEKAQANQRESRESKKERKELKVEMESGTPHKAAVNSLY